MVQYRLGLKNNPWFAQKEIQVQLLPEVAKDIHFWFNISSLISPGFLIEKEPPFLLIENIGHLSHN